MIYKYGDQFKG